jgi:hypothetical protein
MQEKWPTKEYVSSQFERSSCSLNLNSDKSVTRRLPPYTITCIVIRRKTQTSLGKLPSRFAECAALKTGVVATLTAGTDPPVYTAARPQ